MPYNISPGLIRKLPKDQQASAESIGQQLWDKSGGACSLCDGSMNLAAEVLEADHEIPEAEGGETELDNLMLAHQSCNRTKQNLSNAQARPYLQFRRFIRENGGRIKYDTAAQHWGINPKPSRVFQSDSTVSFQFADGSELETPVYGEANGQAEFWYAYVSVPRVAIMNDAEVQPRIIRHSHAFSIYNDLLRNPLHEPPSCRLGPADKEGLQPLLMFDGQHKTVATWMCGRASVVVKLYLNLDKDQANFLVNSIQAKIKKLPLSAFEISAKMSDEWRSKVEEYETEMALTGQAGSEEGFLKWLPSGQERNRASTAFKAALAQGVLSNPDFRILRHVTTTGTDDDKTGLTENMVKAKVIDKMLYAKPLAAGFVESTEQRIQEADNITWMVNQVVDQLLEPDEGATDLTEVQMESRRRLLKQGSLQYIAELLAQVYRQVTIKGDALMLDGTPSEIQRDQIESAINNITDHPVWTAKLDRDEGMAAVKLALEKNQNVRTSFEGVALTLSYAIVGKVDAAYASYWK